MADTPTSPGRLAGRRIVITGASSGIGRATAQLFQAEGATVILFDINGEACRQTLGEGRGLAYAVDVTDEKAVAAAIDDAAGRVGGIDGVANVAGIMITGPTVDFSFADWHRTIGVNLTGTFNVAKCAIPWLKKEKGATIVNVASGAGILPSTPGLAAYAASKGGVISLSRALAADLAPDVRVNCICPGMVMTPMSENVRANVGHYALKRIAEPSEIAEAILFMTSAQSSYVTGAALAVDGGRTFH